LDTYLFFYLKTGGGHLAPAKAVARKIESKHGEKVNIILSDGLKDTRRFVRSIIEDGYRTSVNKAVWVFEFLYAINKIKPVAHLTASIVSFFLLPSVERIIMEQKPDKIVLFHFFMVKPVFRAVERNNLRTKIITVVTDPFTAHPVWFLRKDQTFIVFSEELKEKCLKSGISSESVKVFPFVLDQRFSRKIKSDKALKIKKRLGFMPDSKVILIMGGGDGMPHGKTILRKLIAGRMDAELAVVCGNNAEMFEHVSSLKAHYNARNVKIYRFVDFVHELIAVSDVVITKCGASTFMEILLMGKIPVINNYIWEQEKGNLDYVCREKMGIFERRSKRIPYVINDLFSNKDLYNYYKGNIERASLKNGVAHVSDFIYNYQ